MDNNSMQNNQFQQNGMQNQQNNQFQQNGQMNQNMFNRNFRAASSKEEKAHRTYYSWYHCNSYFDKCRQK